MRKNILSIVLFVILLVTPAVAFCKGGIIAFIDNDVIVVQTNQGFTCAEIIGVTIAQKGDRIYGIQDTYGSQSWSVPRYDSDFTVFVDDFWLSADDAIAWLRNN